MNYLAHADVNLALSLITLRSNDIGEGLRVPPSVAAGIGDEGPWAQLKACYESPPIKNDEPAQLKCPASKRSQSQRPDTPQGHL